MSDLIKRGQALKCSEHDSETYYAISCLPTVDAIPVEWIKKYAEEHRAYIRAFEDMLAEWAERKEE